MSEAVTRLNAALEGRYRIESELGEGGMATVYLAEDLSTSGWCEAAAYSWVSANTGSTALARRPFSDVQRSRAGVY